MGARRSLHFVPGANERMLEKALGLPADALILDLEDAVAPERKADARAELRRWLDAVDFGGRERIVRTNPLESPWGEADLEMLLDGTPPDALLVPKVRDESDLHAIDLRLRDLERRGGHAEGSVAVLVIATETPHGVFALPRLASAPRVEGLTWGAEDLSAALGARRNRDDAGRYLPVFAHCRIQTLLAAAAGGVAPIDGVYVDFRDAEGLARECAEGADMGFTGKMTIHPSQVEIVNEAFTPSAEAVADARALIEAFAAARAEGRTALSWRGEMVDVPHLERARRIVSLAERLGV